MFAGAAGKSVSDCTLDFLMVSVALTLSALLSQDAPLESISQQPQAVAPCVVLG